jgi:hypothetical protein
MPQPATAKSTSSADQRLAYLEQLTQTLMGLQSSNRSLITRRGFADANETRRIDIQISVNDSDWARVMAKQTLYYTENVQFKPPTAVELESIRNMVATLDGFIASQTKANAIIVATTNLVQAFNNSEV